MITLFPDSGVVSKYSKDSSSAGGEISSANYVARKFGIKAGMWMRAARELCPEVVVLPYNFQRIQETSETLYRLLCKVGAL